MSWLLTCLKETNDKVKIYHLIIYTAIIPMPATTAAIPASCTASGNGLWNTNGETKAVNGMPSIVTALGYAGFLAFVMR